MTRAKVPPVAVRYFGGHPVCRTNEHPIVVREYRGRWSGRLAYKKRISGSWARKLRAEGVTHVDLEAGGRVAQFSTAELTRCK